MGMLPLAPTRLMTPVIWQNQTLAIAIRPAPVASPQTSSLSSNLALSDHDTGGV